MGIVEEKLDETLYWLEVSCEAGFLLVNSAFGYPLGVPHSEFDPPANTSRMRLPS